MPSMAPPYTNFLGGPVFWGQVRTTLDKDALREELAEIFNSEHMGGIDVDTLLARCEHTGSPFEKLSISLIN